MAPAGKKGWLDGPVAEIGSWLVQNTETWHVKGGLEGWGLESGVVGTENLPCSLQRRQDTGWSGQEYSSACLFSILLY